MSKSFNDIIKNIQPIRIPDFAEQLSTISALMQRQTDVQKNALQSISNISQFQKGLFDQFEWIQKIQSPLPSAIIGSIPDISIALQALEGISKPAFASYFESLSRIQNINFAEVAIKLEASYESLAFQEYDLLEEIEEIQESTIILPTIETVKQTIQNIYRDNKLLYTINPRRFEELIAELLHNQGYNVELTKQTRDGGYDILALHQIGSQEFKMLVECKRYSEKNTVGIDIIRSFCNVIHTEKANKGLIVTTSTFTSGVDLRGNSEGYLLDLADRNDVLDWTACYLGI